MAVLVDPAVWSWRGRRWAHLVSDEHLDELHEFAGRLGLPPRAFHGDHYDLPLDLHADAVALGAVPVDSRQLVRRLRASGLRLRPAQRRQLLGQVGAGGGVEPLAGGLGVEQAWPGQHPLDER